MLTFTHIVKRYAGRPALDGVSLTVGPGERLALLGHNGAGKSTLIKLALGLLRPDAGRIEAAGGAPGSAAARAATAYLPENAAFHPALTGREQIRHFLRLRGEPARRADDLLAQVGLAEAAGRRIGTYSKGMRQRVGLAQALIGRPRLMLLDEPTSGLDPISRREFYALLEGLAAGGTAILLSSHALSELEARADRMAILSRGRLVAAGTLAELRAEAALPLTATLRARPGAAGALAARFPEAAVEGDRLSFPCAPADKLAVLERLAAARDLAADFDIQAPGLDELYSHVSRRAA